MVIYEGLKAGARAAGDGGSGGSPVAGKKRKRKMTMRQKVEAAQVSLLLFTKSLTQAHSEILAMFR